MLLNTIVVLFFTFFSIAYATDCPHEILKEITGHEFIPTVATKIARSTDQIFDDIEAVQEDIKLFYENAKKDLLKSIEKDIKSYSIEEAAQKYANLIHQLTFPEATIQKYNSLLREINTALNTQGVESRLKLSRLNPSFYNIEIIQVRSSASRAFRLYFKAFKKFNGSELIVSPFENIVKDASARYNPAENSVDLGLNSLKDAFIGKKHIDGLHELRHLLKSQKQKERTDQFAGRFYKSKTHNLEGEAPIKENSFYSDYMSAQEIYTHSADLGNLGAKLKTEKDPKLIKKILNKLRSLKKLSQMSENLLKQITKDHELPHFTFENDDYIISFSDKYGRTLEYNFTKIEKDIYHHSDLDALITLLPYRKRQSFMTKYERIQTQDHYLWNKNKLIRETLIDEVIVPKLRDHNRQFLQTVINQSNLCDKVIDEINSGKLNIEDISSKLYNIAKQVKIP